MISNFHLYIRNAHTVELCELLRRKRFRDENLEDSSVLFFVSGRSSAWYWIREPLPTHYGTERFCEMPVSSETPALTAKMMTELELTTTFELPYIPIKEGI